MGRHRKTGFYAAIAIVLVAAVMITVWVIGRIRASDNTKSITIEVVHSDHTVKTVNLKTKVDHLRGALEQEGLVEGIDTEYGLIITSVDGVAADGNNKESWVLTKAGKAVDTSLDTTLIADGDKFEFTHKTG